MTWIVVLLALVATMGLAWWLVSRYEATMPACSVCGVRSRNDEHALDCPLLEVDRAIEDSL